MIVIFNKELNSFFSTPVGYIVIALFLLATSLLLWVLPGEWNVMDAGYANLDGLFVLAPWLYLFLCPAITMRMFAEERASGTMELLLTRPVSRWSVVLGKALAAWLLVAVALLPSLVWFGSVWMLAQPVGNVDTAAFWGSWSGLLMLAMLYVSVGLFGSSLSKNQIVAFVVSAIVSFLLYYGFDLLGGFFGAEGAAFVRSLGIRSHYQSIARGVVDSRDVIYFAALSALSLFLTKTRLK